MFRSRPRVVSACQCTGSGVRCARRLAVVVRIVCAGWLVSCDDRTTPATDPVSTVPTSSVPSTPPPGATCEMDGSIRDVASASFHGAPLEGVGASIAAVGDVDGDGAADVLVGAPGNGTNGAASGAAYLMYGGSSLEANVADMVVWLGATDETLGFTVGGAGDIDGNGFSDVVIGSFGYDGAADNVGAAYLFWGTSSGPDDSRRVTIAGTDADGATGRATGAGDIDGDGLGDLLVSTEFGVAYAGGMGLFFGSTLTTATNLTTADADVTFLPPIPDAQLNRMAGEGDMDGDGIPELAVAALGWGEESGAVYLFQGGNPLSSVQDLAAGQWDVRWTGTEGSLAGHEVAFVGDVDGDGRDDLGVGAPYESSIDNKRGAAYLITSFDEPRDQSLANIAIQFDGAMMGSRFGLHLTGGDTNGDGTSEVMFGAKFENRAGFVSGTVYVTDGPLWPGHYEIASTNAPPTTVITGESPGDQMGVVAFVGDINEDGIGDLALGARHHGGGDDFFIDDGNGAAYVLLCGTTPQGR